MSTPQPRSSDGPRPKVRAPELQGRGWLNTGGRDLALADFRGRFLLLDFWTFCCVNCLHVLDELREVERRRGDHLAIVGVHSPKFVHEADADALAAAVERYGVEHAVLDDPALATWDAYTARAWPTLVLVDPEGYVVAQYAGEGHAHAIDALVGELVPRYEKAGTLQRGDGPYVAPEPEPGTLRFPAKAITLPDGTWLVADAGAHRLVRLPSAAVDDPDLAPLQIIGSGGRGHDDGGPDTASFNEPNGLVLLPSEVAAQVGYDVVVADSTNHLLRGVALADGSVRTLAGDGRQWMQGGDTASLSTPWDVAWFRDRVWIAMAGIHQLWTFDPRTGDVEVVAGTTNEGLEDGVAAGAWFAQPSGLAVSADGETLYVADAEVSAVRAVTYGEHTSEAPEFDEAPSGPALLVETLVGRGLFDFGLVDGPATDALLQHPLGVTVLPDGSIAVHDTYNGAVRRLSYDAAEAAAAASAAGAEEPDEYGDVVATEADPRWGWSVSTLATGLAEPSGGVVDGDTVVVVESAAHRLTRVRLGVAATAPEQVAHRTRRAVTDLSADGVRLRVEFTPPPGEKLDESFGPSTQVMVESTPPGLLLFGAGTSTDLDRELQFSGEFTEGVLHVSARAASCDAEAEHGTCHIHQQDWGVPVRLVDEGGREDLALILAG